MVVTVDPTMPAERSERPGETRRRRTLLRAGASALATGILSATAGCVATLPPLGRRVRYGRVDAPGADDPAYRRWLPAPSAFESEHGRDGYGVQFARPGDDGREQLGRAVSFPRSMFAPWIDYFGIDYEAYDRAVRAGPAIVLEADVDRQSVRDVVSSTGYRAAGEYRGYDLFDRSDTARTVAVGDGAVLEVRGETRGADARTVIDASRGDAPRYHEVDADFRTVGDAAGASSFTWIHGGASPAGDEPDLRYNATSFRFDSGAVYVVMHWLYPDGDEPTESEVKEALDERSRPRRAFSVDVTVDGRVATIELRGDEGAFDLQEPERVRANWPVITWGVDHEESSGTVTLRHEAGDPIDAADLDLVLRAGGYDGTPPQFADEYDRVKPGDALTVDVSGVPPDSTLRLSYGPVDGTVVSLLSYDL